MPVLLMARGDKASREQLKGAIEARYGHRPPVIETMQIDFKGRARVKVGPVSTWVPLELKAMFKFPDAMRWDFTAKPAGVPLRRGVESYDGDVLRTLRGNDVMVVEDEAKVDAVAKRLWAIAALLLTPLGDMFVELAAADANTFTARNVQTEASVNIHLQENKRIDRVFVEAFNADANKVQTLGLRVDDELKAIDDVLLPSKILSFWDEDPWFEVEPIHVVINPDIPESVFTLTQEVEPGA